MFRRIKLFALSFLLLLLTGFLCFAQNNKYKIDDSCYPLYRTADSLLGTDYCEVYIDKLKQQAEQVHDDKAVTLASVLSLRNAIRGDKETEILVRYGELKKLALRTGYLQYYFYAYQLVSIYYFNGGQRIKGLEYAMRMYEEACEMDNDYGKWFSARTLADYYLVDYKKSSALKFYQELIDIYDSTEDPTIKAQSMAKVYTNLALLSGYDSQQYLGYTQKALETSKISADTLLVNYCLACRSLVEKDLKSYEHYKDKCLSNPIFSRIRLSGESVFELTDKVAEGEWAYVRDNLKRIERLEDLLLFSNLGIAYEQLWLIEESYNLIVSRLGNTYEGKLSQALMETEVALENDRLREDLLQQKTRANNFLLALIIFIVLVVIFLSVLISIYIKKLQKAKAEADMANRMKTYFVQNMSHEIRTPLNAVLGFSQILAYSGDSLSEEEKDEYSSYIATNSSLLTTLIDDILDIADINSGNYRISLAPCRCNDICRQSLKTVEHRLPFGVNMRFESSVSDDLTVMSDANRMQQVIINLLTNSCKHTSEGEIVLRCSTDIKEGYVTFAIQDSGSGISEENADKIFSRFSKLDSFTQGSGLGLNISRILAEKMGGIVELDKSFGKVSGKSESGSRFYFHLSAK